MPVLQPSLSSELASDWSKGTDLDWHASTALARCIIQNPAAFGSSNPGNRTLELGAGSGLVGLVWKAMSDLDPSIGEALVVASDFHQQTLSNLAHTIHDTELAELEGTGSSTPCLLKSEKLDWAALHASRKFTKAMHAPQPVLPAPFDIPFDTILASDVIYESTHALHIHSTVEQLLARPPSPWDATAAPWEESAFWLSIPILETHAVPIECVEEIFSGVEEDGKAKSDWTLGIQSATDELHGDAGCRIYRIGWC